ncbi:MAG: ABC transporter ATP-binding protein [Pseudomonadota bacterium]
MNEPAILKLFGISRRFPAVAALSEINLEIDDGEFFCLLGGSGSGKSTLLRLMAGLDRPTSGHIKVDGADITNIPSWERPVSMMFQSYALFPHMSVASNIAYALKRQNWEIVKINRRVGELLELVQLVGYDSRRPDELSGGEQQRVALARALAAKPKLLLLDEPLSALDKKLREETQNQLKAVQKETGTTFVMVTHDPEEAMSMATRIGILEDGELLQTGNPQTLYDFPNSRTVAETLGRINLLEATSKNGEILCPSLGCKLATDTAETLKNGQSGWVAIRPENIHVDLWIEDNPGKSPNHAHGVLDEIKQHGNSVNLKIRLDTGFILQASISQRDFSNNGFAINMSVQTSFQPGAIYILKE